MHNDYTEIIGTEPKDLKYIYSVYPHLSPEISYGSFSITNYPDIKVYEIITDPKELEREYKQLENYLVSAKDQDMGSMYKHYNEVESVYGIIEIYDIINLPGHPMNIPERNSISSSNLYRMKDGSLKVTYFTGDLYYDIEDCKKVAIKGMKSAFEFADSKFEEIRKQIENEKKDWEKIFSEYPHLVV